MQQKNIKTHTRAYNSPLKTTKALLYKKSLRPLLAFINYNIRWEEISRRDYSKYR
jgi:hypothetical protein